MSKPLVPVMSTKKLRYTKWVFQEARNKAEREKKLRPRLPPLHGEHGVDVLRGLGDLPSERDIPSLGHTRGR